MPQDTCEQATANTTNTDKTTTRLGTSRPCATQYFHMRYTVLPHRTTNFKKQTTHWHASLKIMYTSTMIAPIKVPTYIPTLVPTYIPTLLYPCLRHLTIQAGNSLNAEKAAPASLHMPPAAAQHSIECICNTLW